MSRPCRVFSSFQRLQSPILALLGALASSIAIAAPMYSLTVLPGLDGHNYSHGYAVNDAGQVVGRGGASIRAFIWDSTNGMQSLGTLTNTFHDSSIAYGINNVGQVVGRSNNQAFLWDSINEMQGLGFLPGGNASTAWSINDAGQVVGYSTGLGMQQAFLWDSSAGLQDLGAVPGGIGSQAYGINNAGQVVGGSTITLADRPAFLWDSSNGMQNLGTPAGKSDADARAINDLGQVVGSSYGPGGSFGAFFWDSSNGMQLIGNSSHASGINNAGQVVGQSYDGSGSTAGYSAFLWTDIDGQLDLNSLISPSPMFTLRAATGISETGYITGYGYDSSLNAELGFLLTPIIESPVSVPEPHLFLLFGTGLAILFGLHRRRTQNAT